MARGSRALADERFVKDLIVFSDPVGNRIEVFHGPQIASEPVYGNRFAYFEFSKPEGAQIIRHQFQIKVWELRWNLDPDRISTPSAGSPEMRETWNARPKAEKS